jgi:gas vesicle protein
MTRNNGLPIFLAGVGVGAAVGLLLVANSRGELGTRARKALRMASEDLTEGSRRFRERVGAVLSGGEQALKERGNAMSSVKDKLKDKIDDAANASKKVVDSVVDKSKDVAHDAGENLERGRKRLQNA